MIQVCPCLTLPGGVWSGVPWVIAPSVPSSAANVQQKWSDAFSTSSGEFVSCLVHDSVKIPLHKIFMKYKRRSGCVTMHLWALWSALLCWRSVCKRRTGAVGGAKWFWQMALLVQVSGQEPSSCLSIRATLWQNDLFDIFRQFLLGSCRADKWLWPKQGPAPAVTPARGEWVRCCFLLWTKTKLVIHVSVCLWPLLVSSSTPSFPRDLAWAFCYLHLPPSQAVSPLPVAGAFVMVFLGSAAVCFWEP